MEITTRRRYRQTQVMPNRNGIAEDIYRHREDRFASWLEREDLGRSATESNFLPAGFTWSDMPDPTWPTKVEVRPGTSEAGLYMAAIGSPTEGQANAIAAADFNSDGNPDLALVTVTGGGNVQLGAGNGTFDAPTELPIPAGTASDVVAAGSERRWLCGRGGGHARVASGVGVLRGGYGSFPRMTDGSGHG